MEIGKVNLEEGWLAARCAEISVNGIQLTTTYPPVGPISPWMNAVIPGTVLATLLENKLIPDPFYGLQNDGIIDIADSGRDYYTFWFFKKFICKPSGNQYVELNFRAINYSADVFLNGQKRILPKGMFQRHSIDVTNILSPDGCNYLAVLVHPPDHPGRIPPQGGQGGDHEIGRDVAAQYVQGWDWMIPIRDRNTGIWDEVSLSIAGAVKIIDPHLVATFFDNYKRVYLHAAADLENRSSREVSCSITIEVTADVEKTTTLIEHFQTLRLFVPARTEIHYTFPPLFFYKPDLWWPNGMGKQSLYHVSVTVDVDGSGPSDSWTHPFGFRKIESRIDEKTGGRLFEVNGEKVFIRGANWILSDALLRLSSKRYESDVRFHAAMNLNMIRCWGGGIAERPEFYRWCDAYGLMVWQEFWITGDCDGRGDPVSNVDGPEDHELFMLCATDTVRLLRNHPSLVIWVGGNEQVPPPDIDESLAHILRVRDSDADPTAYLDGTRPYVSGSLWDGFADGSGGFSDGPYEIQNPDDFFRPDFYRHGFNPEIGSVGMPVVETVTATMPEEGRAVPLFRRPRPGTDDEVEEIPHPLWVHHKYIPYSRPGRVADQIASYGEPHDLADFCTKAQLANYVQYRALLEGWGSMMWMKYTGMLIWKSQNPWPGLRGQLYDHLHDQTGGFFGCRCAAEPVHVQMNPVRRSVEVVNTTRDAFSGLALECSVWGLAGDRRRCTVIDGVAVPAKTAATVGGDVGDNDEPVWFVRLRLYRPSDSAVVSRNFYWTHAPGGDYRALEAFRSVRVPLRIAAETTVRGSVYEVRMAFHNIGGSEENEWAGEAVDDWTGGGGGAVRVTEVEGDGVGVAFFLRISVHGTPDDDRDDDRVLPVHYSDNYFSLVPGERMTVRASFEVPRGFSSPRIVLRGWNFHHNNICVNWLH